MARTEYVKDGPQCQTCGGRYWRIESFTAARREVTPDLTVKNVFVGKNVLSDTFGLPVPSAVIGNATGTTGARSCKKLKGRPVA